MKRKIGIGFLIGLNFTFVLILIMLAIFTYVLSESSLQEPALTNDILLKAAVLSSFVCAVNYLLLHKIILIKKALLKSCLIVAMGIIVFSPFFISARQTLLNYQNKATQLQQYLNTQTIIGVQIITHTDTIKVSEVHSFVSHIDSATSLRWPVKYAKSIKLIFEHSNGQKDTLLTNGQIFGPYQGKFFKTEINVIDNYLRN
jgi:hypothetical protein